MTVPDYVQFCINRLESAGFAAYAVGALSKESLLEGIEMIR